MNASKLLAVLALVSVAWVLAPAGSQGQEGEALDRPITAIPSSVQTVWDYRTLDTGSDKGPHSTIAVDPLGQVHVFYCDSSAGSLMYTYKDAASWHGPSALPMTDVRCDRWDAAIDGVGRWHVAYEHGVSAALRHAYEMADGWGWESIAGETEVSGVSLALDGLDYPHVAYRSAAVSGQLTYARKDGSGWRTPEVVDSTLDSGWYASLAVDGSGWAHISYTRLSGNGLWYAERKITGWTTQAVDPDVGIDTLRSSLAVTDDGEPHICYYEEADSTISGRLAFRYLYHDNLGWHGPYAIDDLAGYAAYTEYGNFHCSLAIDGSGFVHMTYHNEGDLTHYFQNAQGWWTEPVALEGAAGENAGQYNSLAVTHGGQPYVSYYHEADGGKIVYAGGENRAPILTGNTACAWGDGDCNRCAERLVDRFNNLRQSSDILGFRLGNFPNPEWIIHQHWQGVQRLPTNDGQYLIVTQDQVEDDNGKDKAGFAVVKMASRNDEGLRFRSNRLWPSKHVNETTPPSNDAIVHSEIIPSDENHPGSIQVMGNLMPVGVDDEVHLYNLAVPTAPQYLGKINIDRTGKTGSSTAMAQLADGRYLLVVADGSAAKLDFYVSTLPNSYAHFSHVDEWEDDEVVWTNPPFKWGWNSFQNVNLITDCDTGKLYLLGTGNLGTGWFWFEDPWGPDWAALYEIEYKPNSSDVKLTKVADRHFYCSYYGEAHCNFDAAAGAYVDPDGLLLLYATEHENTGPQETIKAMEFRPQPHGTCPTIEDAWVELFQDSNFENRSRMIDYVDTEQSRLHHPTHYEQHWRYDEYLDDYGRFVGIDGLTSSVSWCLPRGWAYRLYEESSPSGRCAGDFLSLYGAGSFWALSNLEAYDFNDEASCSTFSYDPPIVIKSYPGTSEKLIHAAYLHEQSSAAALAASTATDEPPPDADMVTIIDVPAGAVDQETDITLTPSTALNPPDPPRVIAHRAFVLGVEMAGTPQPDYVFGRPLEVTLQVHDQEIIDVDEDSLALYRWDDGGGAWVDATKTCDPAGGYVRQPEENRLSLSICRAGEFALMGTRLPARVLFDEAHNSQKTIDWGRAQELADSLPWHPDPLWLYYGDLAQELSGEFGLERNASAPLTGDLLRNYEALILDTNEEPLTSEEVSAVRTYVASGGGLVLLGECGYQDPNPELAASFGITFQPSCLFGPGESLEGTIVVTNVLDHAANEDASEYAHNWGAALTLDKAALALADTLGTGAWQDANGNEASDPGEEGVYNIMAAFDAGCGRVVALADGTFANADLEWNDNDVLMRSMLKWVTQSTPCKFEVYLPLVVRE